MTKILLPSKSGQKWSKNNHFDTFAKVVSKSLTHSVKIKRRQVKSFCCFFNIELIDENFDETKKNKIDYRQICFLVSTSYPAKRISIDFN